MPTWMVFRFVPPYFDYAFYRLTPTLIDEGYVYIAESPLFEITTKDKTYFAYDESEKVKIMDIIGDKKCTIQRSKGLGEKRGRHDGTYNDES